MTNTKNGSNQGMVPEARAAMDQFKMEAASEVGVNLKQGYNGDLTSRQAGSIGGQMVKKMCPVHTSSFERNCRTAVGHCVRILYTAEWTEGPASATQPPFPAARSGFSPCCRGLIP